MASDHLSTTLAALADPTRRAILARLATGEATVTELAAPFNMSLPGVSKHLKVLRQAGLIEQGRDAHWRPCRLRPQPLRDVSLWLERYRHNWETSFEALDEVLRELQTPSAADHITSERIAQHDHDEKRPHRDTPVRPRDPDDARL